MEQQPRPSSEQASKDDKSPDSSDYSIQANCCVCFWLRRSDSTPMSTTEEMTQSSTEPTDATNSLNEDVVMGDSNPEQQSNLNPEQQSHRGRVSDPGKWRLIKKCLPCQQQSSQESTESNDDPTDPTDVSSSSSKEGIEMDNMRQVNEASALQTEQVGAAESSDSKTEGTAGVQEGVPEERETTDTDPRDLPVETRV